MSHIRTLFCWNFSLASHWIEDIVKTTRSNHAPAPVHRANLASSLPCRALCLNSSLHSSLPDLGFLGGLVAKNPPAKACHLQEVWVRALGREDPPGEGDGNPLQCSRLGNPMDRRACWVTVHGAAKSWTRLSTYAHTLIPWLILFHPLSFSLTVTCSESSWISLL